MRRWASDRSGRPDSLLAMAAEPKPAPLRLVDLELDLDVFAGPFDLLLTLILREEVDLLEVDLADIVISYIDHLERRGELDLEAATEFLVLIAALLELKSRLMLPGEEIEELELDPGEAAERAARAAARRPALSRGCPPPRRAACRAGRLPLPLRAAALRTCAGRRCRRPRRSTTRARCRRRDRRPAGRAAGGRRPPHPGVEGDRRRAAAAPAGAAARAAASASTQRSAAPIA